MINRMLFQLVRQLWQRLFTNLFPVARMPDSMTEALEAAEKGWIELNPPVGVNDHFRGRLNYDRSACIGCKLCIRVCPANAIEFLPEDKKIQVHVDRCCFCAQCVEICPVKIDLPAAIRLVRERAVARSALARLTGLAAARLFGSPRLWRWGGRGLRSLLGRGVALGPLRDWAATRELPPSPSASLSDCMKGDDGNA